MEGQSIINNYSIWLSSKLQELKLDETVYADYITGVLEGEDSYEEKMETISSILSGSVVGNGWIVFPCKFFSLDTSYFIYQIMKIKQYEVGHTFLLFVCCILC